MPTVLRIGGYRFFFVALDRGEPAHVHVRREKKVAKIWLDPVSIERTGGFKEKELSRILKLVEEHVPLFLEKWHEFFE
jgi:hypothetical protein